MIQAFVPSGKWSRRLCRWFGHKPAEARPREIFFGVRYCLRCGQWIVAVFIAMLLLSVAASAHAESSLLFSRMKYEEPMNPKRPLMAGWTFGSLGKWLGYPGKFYAWKRPEFDAWHSDCRKTTFTYGTLGLAPEVQFLILLHELHHCVQYRRGELKFYLPEYPLEILRLEQEADAWAAEYACRLGFDGVGWMRALVEYLTEGKTHGTRAERLANVEARAVSCRKTQEAR